MQTRLICAYVAATVPVEKGQNNELLESAWTIGVRKGEEPTAREKAEIMAAPGSYEAAMRMLKPRS